MENYQFVICIHTDLIQGLWLVEIFGWLWPNLPQSKLRYAFIHTHRVTHIHYVWSKPKATGAQLAKSPRQSSVTNVSADELEDQSRTGMRCRKDNRDRPVLSSAVVLNVAEADSTVEHGIDRQELSNNCRVISADRNSDKDAGRLSPRHLKRSDHSDRPSARNSQRQSEKGRHSFTEQLFDTEKQRKRSPSSVCRSSASHQLSRSRKWLQWAESDRSSSQSRSRSSSYKSGSSETKPTRQKKLVKCLSNSEISSPEKQSVNRSLYTQRQYLKPPKFDSSIALESFLVQFQNCAAFNISERSSGKGSSSRSMQL